MQPSYRRLQQCAIGISVLSILYNGAEGGVSIGLGAESGSRSLIFFGVQSGLEVVSACIVVWRFSKVAKPGEERNRALETGELKIERIASASIGALLIALALATEASSIFSLITHQAPSSSTSSLIISASALVLMILIYLPKPYLARRLNSSAMQGEATCSLSCIQMTAVLFAGSLIRKVWAGGWWVDSATALALGLLFAWEGIKMVRWVRDPNFDGGCCRTCAPPTLGDGELAEGYKDLCSCCAEKSECKDAGECKCEARSAGDEELGCCAPTGDNGSKCCTHQFVGRHRTPANIDTAQSEGQRCTSGCCAAPDSVNQDATQMAVQDRQGCGGDCCSSPTESTGPSNTKCIEHSAGITDGCCSTTSRVQASQDSCGECCSH